jgi:hypothetical protein
MTKLALPSFALMLVACTAGTPWNPYPSSSSGSSGDNTQDQSGSSKDPAAAPSSPSSSGATGSAAVCDTKSKCSKDNNVDTVCKAAVSGRCGSEYAAYYTCLFAKQTCTAQDVTDQAALARACSTEATATATCLSKSSSSGNGNSDNN